jgi:hypothetical protein
MPSCGELELYSTRNLIEELLRRTTFQGVIVHAVEEARRADWEGERTFAVRHSASLEVEQAGRLLDVVGDYIASRE